MGIMDNVKQNLLLQINKKEIELTKKKELANFDFIAEYGTQGGISFKDEKVVKTGDGYETCLYVYKYPNNIKDNWLSPLANQDDTIVVFDIGNMDKHKALKNIDRSMEEQSSRYTAAKSHSERKDAQQKYREANLMYDEVTIDDDTIKILVTRIYISAKTLAELDEKIKEVKTELDTLGYKSAVSLNENKEDWKDIILPRQKQSKLKRKPGQEILSSQLAIGNPFYFSSLNDPCGTYYGDTFANTGGSVLLDLFRVTNQRMSYNTVVFGKMGSGKSTTLKKIFLDRAARGDLVRVFDVTGEYTELTETFGGKVISLDGSNGQIINALQIRKTDDSMDTCYSNHISMLSTIYKTLRKDADSLEVLMFEKLLNSLYIKLLIVPEDGLITEDITSFSPNEYPIWSDFLKWVRLEKQHMLDIGQESSIEYKQVTSIELVIESLIKSFGHIFDGYTTLDDIYGEKIISFNISKLKNLKPEIFDTQLLMALSLCWENCISVGMPMLDKWNKREISFEDITRFIILFDESHRCINANKISLTEQVLIFMREARKYFGGICLASQSIRDYVPDDASKEGVDMMKTLFELCTYKFIMQQDIAAKKKLEEIFSDQITSYELNKVSTLSKGETILMISSDRNLHFQIQITDEENRLFAGGA